ncbi:glycoside hydrolase domain-containing protein [Streptomyces sp. NPDC047108]|uniref:glycoside hydrolase domain-containing protein n=1 Tax=Streptomyces sp. NPDC047108 TaxID=3155025 RepID=UPI0033C716D8
MRKLRATHRIRPSLTLLVAAVTGGALTFVLAPPATADPATPVTYPSGGTSTRFSGQAFDTCSAPTLDAMKAWGSSPYRAVGIYFGGVNRTCSQPQLTPDWVGEVTGLGWRLLPIYKGLQPACGARAKDEKITSSGAAAEGRAAARDAVSKAKALGLLPGSAFYNDIENYSRTDTGCRDAVLTYLSAWTKELHARGYLSGVYMNLNHGAKDLADAHNSSSYARPDALWIARYDGTQSLTGWEGIGASQWAVHQRAKQYTNSHDETYGGVRINIDSDRLDAPVATVAHPYKVTSSSALSARSGPTTTASVVRSVGAGASVNAVCQTPGSKVGDSSVWNKLSDGTYIADSYVNTPSDTGYSEALPRCAYPYQVTAADGVNLRTGAGTANATAGTIPGGALAWVVCQAPGSDVNGTKVWNKLDNGRWVSDYYVSNASNTTYSKPAPRC